MKKSEEKEKPSQPSVADNLLTPETPLIGLKPKGLDFTTPRSSSCKSRETFVLMTPSTPETPATPGQGSNISDVESLGSEASSITPEMSKLNLGRSRGRPRKVVEKPNMDDFPLDGSQEEQKHYLAKKNTEMLRYKKLTGVDSAEYWKAEAQRVKTYQQRKKREAEETDDSTESSKERQRKQQQVR